jgi:hypothetical protein
MRISLIWLGDDKLDPLIFFDLICTLVSSVGRREKKYIYKTNGREEGKNID